MKVVNTLLTLMLLANLAQASQEDFTVCHLQVFVEDMSAWHDLIEGLMYGLRFDPEETVNDCHICNLIGHAAAGAQASIVHLELTRDDWLTDVFVGNGDIFTKIKKLLGVFAVLTAFGVNIDIIWRSLYI